MTRRGAQPLDPELDKALVTLPEEMRRRLVTLRMRLLLAPQAHKYQGWEVDPLTEGETEALSVLQKALQRRESEA